MMSKEKRRVPKLRFPGFTKDWEQRKLGDLYKRVNERNDGTLGRDKWISVAKMYFQDPDKVQSNNLDTRTYVMKKGDIAFEGHPNNEFKFGRFVLNDIGTGIISELFPIYRPITEYDLDFWKYAIQLERVMAPIFAKSITSSGNSSNKLDHNHFLNQELLVPNIEEQKKIGSLLSILSKNITLHQRKLDNLKLKKKSLLQKLFPKNGERYPELRFPGFTDAWEQRKFGDLFEYERPDAYIVKSDNYNNDFNMPVLTANKAFILGYTNEENSYNKPSIIFDDFTLDRKYVDFPYMLKSSAIKILTSKNQHNLRFLFERLNSTRFEVLGHARHYISVVQNTTTLCPSVNEEICISNLLTKFDELITLHQRKLDHLQLQKKALLQQMFV